MGTVYFSPGKAIELVQASSLAAGTKRVQDFVNALPIGYDGMFEYTDGPITDDGLDNCVIAGAGVGSVGPGFRRVGIASVVVSPAVQSAINYAVDAVVYDIAPADAVAHALIIGPRFGRVVLAPLGTGADDDVRYNAVEAACAAHNPPYPVEQLPGTWYHGTTPYVVPARAPIAVSLLKIMFCGDSQTAGGDGLMADNTTRWRGPCWERLRAVRGGIKLFGLVLGGVYDNRAAAPTGNAPGNVTLGDWHMAATGGWTISQVAAAAAAAEAVQGAADVYAIMAGTNDVRAGHTAVQVLASLQAFVVGRLAANPNAIVLVGTIALFSPAEAGYVAENVVLSAINTALPSACASWGQNVHCVEAGSLVGMGSIEVGGYHPTSEASALIGRAFADAILMYVGIAEAPFPRKLIERIPKNRWEARTTTSTVTITENANHGLLPSGTQSFSVGFLYRPTSVPGLAAGVQRAMLQAGDTQGPVDSATSGLFLYQASPGWTDANWTCLNTYIGGQNWARPNDCLRLNRWHAIVITYDAGAHELSTYCIREGDDGRPVSTLVSQINGLAAFTWPTGTQVYLGAHAGIADGTTAALGQYGDLWLARGVVTTVDEAESFFIDGAVPAGATAVYELADGPGTVAAPDAGMAGYLPNGVATDSWSLASVVPEPWHRGSQLSIPALGMTRAKALVQQYDGLLLDPDAGIQYWTQPVIGNWTNGTGWSGTGLVYTHAGAGGAGDLTQAIGSVGDRMQLIFTVTGLAAGGSITPSLGTTALAAITANGTYSVDGLDAGNTTLKLACSAHDAVVTFANPGVKNLGVNIWRPSVYGTAPIDFTGGFVYQNTAANRPWLDQTKYNGKSMLGFGVDAVDALTPLTWAANAFNGLHDGSGGTLVQVIRPSNGVAQRIACTMSTAGYANIGLLPYLDAADHLVVDIGNGSGTAWGYTSTSTARVLAGSSHIVAIRSKAATVSVRVDGTPNGWGGGGGIDSPSASNSDNNLNIGRDAGISLIGDMGMVFYFPRYLTDADMVWLERTLADYYGITLAGG